MGPARTRTTMGWRRTATTVVAVLTLAASSAACTPPNGGVRPGALSDKTADDSNAPSPALGVGVLRVRGSDGSVSLVSRGNGAALSSIPAGVPIIAGDVDLVQTITTQQQSVGYYVIVTAPGRPSHVYASIERSLVGLGFAAEDGSLSNDGGTARAEWSMAAGVFATVAHRVTVGVVPAGRASSTVTYAIVPATV